MPETSYGTFESFPGVSGLSPKDCLVSALSVTPFRCSWARPEIKFNLDSCQFKVWHFPTSSFGVNHRSCACGNSSKGNHTGNEKAWLSPDMVFLTFLNFIAVQWPRAKKSHPHFDWLNMFSERAYSIMWSVECLRSLSLFTRTSLILPFQICYYFHVLSYIHELGVFQSDTR